MPLANQSRGQILDYTVALTKASGRGQLNRTTVPHSDHRLMLSLDPAEEYIVSIMARNINGSSPPTTITIPTPGRLPAVEVNTWTNTWQNGKLSF